jgi:hypothetical protein
MFKELMMDIKNITYKILVIDDNNISNNPPLNLELIKIYLDLKEFEVEIIFEPFTTVDNLRNYFKTNPDFDIVLFDIELLNTNMNDELFPSLFEYKSMNRLSKTILFSSHISESELKGLEADLPKSLLLQWVNDYRINGIYPRSEKIISSGIEKCIYEIDPITLNMIHILSSYKDKSFIYSISGKKLNTSELISEIRTQSEIGKDFISSLTNLLITRYALDGNKNE